MSVAPIRCRHELDPGTCSICAPPPPSPAADRLSEAVWVVADALPHERDSGPLADEVMRLLGLPEEWVPVMRPAVILYVGDRLRDARRRRLERVDPPRIESPQPELPGERASHRSTAPAEEPSGGGAMGLAPQGGHTSAAPPPPLRPVAGTIAVAPPQRSSVPATGHVPARPAVAEQVRRFIRAMAPETLHVPGEEATTWGDATDGQLARVEAAHRQAIAGHEASLRKVAEARRILNAFGARTLNEVLHS